MVKIFTQLPEELFQHSLWKNASNDYRSVLIVILRYTAFEDQPTTGLLKGQFSRSLRLIALEANVPKSTVFHAIEYFMGFTTRRRRVRQLSGNEVAILVGQDFGQDFGQKVGQEMPVYNIMLDGYYKNSRTESRTASRTESRTASRTAVGQQSDSSPGKSATQTKKLKKELEETATVVAADILQPLKMPQSDKDWLAQRYYDKCDLLIAAIEYVTDPDFFIKTTLQQVLKWALIYQPWKNKQQRKTVRERVMEAFVNGEFYNGAECFINEEGIAFQRGIHHDVANFKQGYFFEKLGKLLESFQIENPFKEAKQHVS